MTKDLKLEDCVNLLTGGPSSAHNKSSKVLNTSSTTTQVTSSAVVAPLSEGFCQSSSFSPPPSKMLRSSKSDLRNGCKCTIRLLDDNEILQCDFKSHHKGNFLMDYVCRQLNIGMDKKDYFGLRYVDSNKQRHWLDIGKSITKQMKDNAYILCFRFKFYPKDPILLKEASSTYQLVLQLRRDLLHGRLYSTVSDMATIVSFILQSELGDYDPEAHVGNYAAEYELISRQTQEMEEKAMELHQKLRGLTPSEADTLFLKKVASLDTYGLDPCPVKDQQGEQLYLGINHLGISTFQNCRKVTHFKWSQIAKLNYEAKMFIIHLSIAEDSRIKKKETVGFKCQSSSACKFLWRCAVEQRLFFNCGSAADVPSSIRGGGIFGSRLRFHGRVQREILEDPGPLRSSDAVIQRTPLYRSLQRSKTRSLPHSPSHPGYGSLPRSNHSAPTNDGMRMDGGTLGSSASLPLSTLSSPYGPDVNILETLQEDSPRVENKGKGTKLVRNDSVRSTTSVISSVSMTMDEPDLSFLQNRVVSNASEMLLCDSREQLMSITEEHEDDADKKAIGKFAVNENAKTGNGYAHNLQSVSDEKGDEVKVSNGTVAQLANSHEDTEFAPAYNSAEGDKDEKTLRDSKIDQISTPLLPGKSNGFAAMWKIFLICFLCVVVSLLFVAITVIELDVDVCRRMRHIPEVEYFQFEVYEPFKTYMRAKLHGIEHFRN